MSGSAVAALVVWLVVSAGSLWVWLPPGRSGRKLLGRTSVLLATVTGVVVLTGVAALLGARASPVRGAWSWVAVGLSAVAAVLAGGAVVICLLGLADSTARPDAARVQRTVLRGGTWIGALERLALFATLLAGWPEGIAAIVAVKAFARYPELKNGQATGAIERFIIGTFASLGWASVCAGVALVLLR
ncbi:MAG TPA: hypothetical protein VIT20_01795 [Propionibacteriaceae bacterium]